MTDFIGTDTATATGNDNITGTSKADDIYGGSGVDTINSGNGNDIVDGGIGNDIIDGGAGLDVIYGNLGDDQLLGGNGADIIYGGAGNDSIGGVLASNEDGSENGGDTIYGDGYNGLTQVGVTNLRLGTSADALGAAPVNDTNTVYSSTNNATISITNGAFATTLGNDFINGGNGNDTIYGDNGWDVSGLGSYANTTGAGNDIIHAGTGNDSVYGEVGDDQLYGENGNDKLYGGSGNDRIDGGNGDDIIDGGTGNDILIGGLGADILTGGTGNDSFVFNATTTSSDSKLEEGNVTEFFHELAEHVREHEHEHEDDHDQIGIDVITDFTASNDTSSANGLDKIDLSALLGTTDLNWGGQIPTANGVWFQHGPDGNTYVMADVNGNTATAELLIRLDGIHNLSSNDFLGLRNAAVVVIDASDITGAVTEIADHATGENTATHTATGTLNFTDTAINSVHTASVVPQSNGYLGNFVLGTVNDVNTSVGWTFTVNDGAIDYLAAGQTLLQTYTIAVANGAGSSALQTVTVTLTGTNDAAVLSSAVSDLTETDAVLTTSGTLTISDVDSAATFVAQTDVSGTYGTFAIDTAGAWTYTASSAHDDFAVDTTYTDTFIVSSADGTYTSVTVNIFGTNDTAVLSSAYEYLVETDTVLTTSGTLTITDVDSAATFVAQTDTAGAYGTFNLGTDGAWTYTASSAHDDFAVDTTYTDTFAVSSADGTNTSVTVNIEGTNDAAVLSSAVENLTETDAVLTTSGTLTITDVDSAATFVAQTNTAGTYGAFTIGTNGAWSYVASSAHNEFVAGTTYTDTFTVSSADGTNTSVTVNIAGTNDAAVITGTSTASLTESSVILNASGQLTATDADSSAAFVEQTAAAGTNGYGAFSIGTDGAWTYATTTAHDEFVAGTTYTDSLTVATADGTTQLLTVSILGTADTVTGNDIVLTNTAVGTSFNIPIYMLLANDTLSLSGITNVSVGTGGTTSTATDFISFTDSSPANGSFTYQAVSSLGAGSPGTVTVTSVTGTSITGTAANEIIIGSSSNDTIVGFVGTDWIDGGTGTDTLTLSGTSADLNAATDAQLVNVEAITTSARATINLSHQTEGFTITGSGGTDTITGGSGNDTISEFIGADSVNGGAGVDTLILYGTSATLNAATDAQLVNVERISTIYGATVTLSNQTEGFTIIGGSSSDIITGGSGNDVIYTAAGNDTIVGFVGADTVDGGAGTDTLTLSGTSATLNTATNEQLVNVEAITTGAAATITLSNQTEGFSITGSSGIDNITGGSGSDLILGGGGGDSIDGGAGNDLITGGTGADTLSGGLGSDTFIFLAGNSGQATGFDIISDYLKGAVGTGDVIDHTADLTIGGIADAATPTTASINQSTGVATFAAGEGLTLADALSDVATSVNTGNSAGDFAFFQVNGTGDYYLFMSDGVDDLGANDVVIDLVGVSSISSIDLTGGNLTITG